MPAYPKKPEPLKMKFENHNFRQILRGSAETSDQSLTTKDCILVNTDQLYTNFEFSFQAQSCDTEGQVQIWAGLGYENRVNRYCIGLRGGNSSDLYFSRYKTLGKDALIEIEPLEQKPEPNKWYDFKIICVGNKIAIYIDNQLIMLTQDASIENFDGAFSLGGGWCKTEFKNIKIQELTPESFPNFDNLETINNSMRELLESQKHELRKAQRAQYKPVNASFNSEKIRDELSLEGDWLFLPDYEVQADAKPFAAETDDKNWHVMNVPNFFNPVRNWLFLQKCNLPKGGSGISDSYRKSEFDRCDGYTFDYKKTASAWYRKHINLSEIPADKQFILRFEAVAKVADVWVNGHYVGGHLGMFAHFEFDITQHLKQGENIIVVHNAIRKFDRVQDADKIAAVAVSVEVNQDMLNSLPYGMHEGTEGGIWQPVSLKMKSPVRIDNIFAKTRTNGAEIDIELNCPANQSLIADLEITCSQTGDKLCLLCGKFENGQQKITVDTGELTPKLWSPEEPNLYKVSVALKNQNCLLDSHEENIGFRTFEIRGDFFYLNGHKYWLRGANHPPHNLRPNDKKLAHQFMKQMHDNNQHITRTHGGPFNKIWMDASDVEGVGVSWEGTWPWLMIDEIPSQELLDLWADEMLTLIKKHRNHPSLFFWTINNEMYFTMWNHGKPREMRLKKWKFISELNKKIRELDPTRPISADSGYVRTEGDYDELLEPNNIDDGDIDDRHIYFGWYNRDHYQIVNGEWDKPIYWSPGKNKNRPFISQECSTGYANVDTGHPTRHYIFKHYVPQAFVGDLAYEDRDPMHYLTRQAMVGKELGETIRRTSPNSAGVLHFSNLTWFRNCFKADQIEKYPIANSMKFAFAPVLISAELFGRAWFSGQTVAPKVCIVNDSPNGQKIENATLTWSVIAGDKTIASGATKIDSVEHYGRLWIKPEMVMPTVEQRENCTLKYTLTSENKTLSENEYSVVIANPNWVNIEADLADKKICIYDPTGETIEALKVIGIEPTVLKSLTFARLYRDQHDLLIVANLDNAPEVPYGWEDVEKLTKDLGLPTLLVHPSKHLKWLLPDTIESIYHQREGRFVNMRHSESAAFEGIDLLELSWWENCDRNMPNACRRSYRLQNEAGIKQLATFMDVHCYLGDPVKKLPDLTGSPLLEISWGKSKIIASEMELNNAHVNPIAAKMLGNLIKLSIEK